MSKANRDKRKQTLDGFPFQLLQCWIKPYSVSGVICTCGDPIAYLIEHYIEIGRMQALIGQGKSEAEALNTIWNKAVSEQRQGIYNKSLTTYHCQACVEGLIERNAGRNTSTLALMPGMIVGERATVLLGATLQSADDDGKTFVACAVASDIETVARQLRSEQLSLHVR